MCPSLGALERLSGVPIKQRSSSAPVAFCPKPQELGSPVGHSLLSPFEGSPFEAFPPSPADAGATMLSRAARATWTVHVTWCAQRRPQGAHAHALPLWQGLKADAFVSRTSLNVRACAHSSNAGAWRVGGEHSWLCLHAQENNHPCGLVVGRVRLSCLASKRAVSRP